jgi:crotonobetainyl-CoA:carnitine CoA-transferase CaiB-like acyl-CoA transferase
MHKPFEDLKIIELAGVLAGPSVGYFFAELGAHVVKIENTKTNGDVTRSWKLKTENPKDEKSAYFWSVNALKESLFLDLSTANGQKTLHQLATNSDIIITNYKKGDDAKLKADYKTLKKINPAIIYASINGFGGDSPRTAYDLILQAESGFMFMNGEPNSIPTKMPVALIDLLAGHQLKEAILIALIKRYKTGKGSCISVSLFDSAIASLVNQATNWLVANHLPVASGSLHPNIAPYGELFLTKDKHYVTFAIGSNKQFEALCSVINHIGLAKDVKYSTNQNRVKNRQQLYGILNQYLSKFTYKQLADSCLKLEIPFGKIRNMKEVFELPEAKQMIREINEKNKTISIISSIAFKFHGE